MADHAITVALGDEQWEIDLYDIDGIEWRDAKRASGYPNQIALLDAVLGAGDFDAVAALVWIWRRRESPDLSYVEVLRSFSYGAINRSEEPSPNTPG